MQKYPFNMIYNPMEEDRAAIDRMRYYQGFKVGKEKNMFENEINDASASYEKELKESEKRLIDINRSLVHYMEIFCEENKKIEVLKRKIRDLHYKLTGEVKND